LILSVNYSAYKGSIVKFSRSGPRVVRVFAKSTFSRATGILCARGDGGLRPACLQVSPRHLISKRHCTGGMRTGGPRTQPAARMVSSFATPFNLKAGLCRGHADRRSAHPAHAPSPRTQHSLSEASYRCSQFLSLEARCNLSRGLLSPSRGGRGGSTNPPNIPILDRLGSTWVDS
jgi:hypothetical protein